MTSAIDPAELAAGATAENLGSYLAGLDWSTGEQVSGPAQSSRTTVHEGHQVTVTTTYHVTVDGAPVTARLCVADSGMLYSPILPYHQFTSALDAVRALISAYPDHDEEGA